MWLLPKAAAEDEVFGCDVRVLDLSESLNEMCGNNSLAKLLHEALESSLATLYRALQSKH